MSLFKPEGMSVEEIIEILESRPDLDVDGGAEEFDIAVYEAIALLKTHPDAKTNNPLSLEELREIDGVVWICYPQATFGTRLPPADHLTCTGYKFSFSEYGKTWFAYRRPPKGD